MIARLATLTAAGAIAASLFVISARHCIITDGTSVACLIAAKLYLNPWN